jgi:voltage-gated potassium channel Kch
MTDQLRNWWRDNHALIAFLGVQALAIMSGAAAILAYAVKLETRVSTMETRGAEYTVARMDEMKLKINALEQKIDTNNASINRIVEIMTRGIDRTTPARP